MLRNGSLRTPVQTPNTLYYAFGVWTGSLSEQFLNKLEEFLNKLAEFPLQRSNRNSRMGEISVINIMEISPILELQKKHPGFNILEILSVTKWVLAPFFKIGKKGANTHFVTLKISNKLKAGCFFCIFN